MIFDKIIANPPYLGDLHLQIIKNVYRKFCTQSVWLHPARWCQSITSPTEFAWIEKGIKDITLIQDSNKELFDGMNISGDLVITNLTSKLDGKYMSDINQMSLRSVFCHNPDVILKIYNKVIGHLPSNIKEHLIIDKPLNKYSVVFSLIGGESGQGNSRISKIVSNLQNCVYTNGVAPNGKLYKDNRGKGVTEKDFTEHLEFNTFQEADNFLASLRTVFMIAINSMSKCDMHVHPNVLPYMNDYTRKWTSKDFYEYFNLTDSEIKELEKVVYTDYPEYCENH